MVGVESTEYLQDGDRLLGAFNRPMAHWLDFFCYTMFVDRDGKFQLGMLSTSAFKPLAASMGPMLKEEAFLGTTSPGTVFQVISVTGVAIRKYSALPNENEVLLPAGSKFVVDKISEKTEHGVTEVRMRQLILP